MKCPTCENAINGICCCCGAVVDVPELQPDPFAQDINNDNSLHLMCPKCVYESGRDI